MKELAETIKAAFSAVRHPGGEHLTSCPCDECIKIRGYFAHRDWSGHSVGQLRNVETALFHLTPKGFRFFLPTFCLAVLEDSDSAAAIPDLIVQNLSPDKSSFAIDRVDQLSAEERCAIVRFLDYLVDANIEDSGDVAPARQLLTSSVNNERPPRSHPC